MRKRRMTDGERVEQAGGFVNIGPECFALADGSVLSWRGENYVPQKPTLRVRFHNWRVARYNRKLTGQDSCQSGSRDRRTRHIFRWRAFRARRRWMRALRGRDSYVYRRGLFNWEVSYIDYERPTRRQFELQRAIDAAYAALSGSQYVGGPSEREAWQTAMRELGSVATQHIGQASS